MRSRKIFEKMITGRWIFSVIAGVFCLSGVAEAATLTVGTCPGAGFSTVQAAVNAAKSGDIVNVCPGSYPEQVSIDKTLTVKDKSSKIVTDAAPVDTQEQWEKLSPQLREHLEVMRKMMGEQH